ncbi:hypothetical protein TR51_17140 [Kitasatospora griseola]|uniref:Uncharacterized protein n=1 Tax=Kitasatospora griseola TaxID=2064 RepID=A0A0D0Q3N3_KITGR|nr:hypothetical protein [Kitasatospora griseola]KIQ65563.1 hypothetical protein TR51_17140 [Kitasatospora griseola]
MPAWASPVLAAAALTALVPFVVWGVRTSPHRLFSWGMYSGSSKGFVWIQHEGRIRPLAVEELRLAPGSHYLNVHELRHLLARADPDTPLNGLIIGSDGGWELHYDPAARRLRLARLPAGQQLRILAEALRETS